MLEKILENKLIFIAIHIVFGYLATLPVFPGVFGLLCFIIPIYLIFSNGNQNEFAFFCASYVVGAEVFIRMTKGFVFYETGKYGVILFLLMGMFLGKFKQVFSLEYITYLFLLLIGIAFTQVPEGESLRKNIIFNLSGPVVLGVAAIYFYKRPIGLKTLLDGLFFMLLPLFSMVTYIYFRTPDLSEIVFGGVANGDTSGGFGPNQVATSIGLGIVILTISILTKYKLSGYIIIDSIFLIYFSFRGLLTFSRGGVITGFISLLLFAIFYLWYKKLSIAVIFKYLIIASFFIAATWLYTSNITGGMLDNRYTGKNASGVKKDISSGRIDIVEIQIDNFMDNPLGIGVGNGKYERLKSLEKVTAASHNEVGRLLEEHGFIGLFILIILMVVPLFNFFNGNLLQKAFIIAFYAVWFLTINHSAMRVALPGFIYGLSLIKLEEDFYE